MPTRQRAIRRDAARVHVMPWRAMQDVYAVKSFESAMPVLYFFPRVERVISSARPDVSREGGSDERVFRRHILLISSSLQSASAG